jgi:NADP-reducing hydrogenase subunit HndB
MAEKIKSPQDLLAMRKKAQENLELRAGEQDMTVTVHMGTCGIAAGARDILAAFAEAIENGGVKGVSLRKSGSAGLTDREPMATLTDKAGKEYMYGNLNAEKVKKIVESHVVNGDPVMDYLIRK